MWEIELVRDIDEIKSEKRLYAKILEQIYLINPFLNMAFLLQTISSPDEVDEYCNRMADLLQASDPEIARRLRQLIHNVNAFTNSLPTTYASAGQTVVLDLFPESQSIPVRFISFIYINIVFLLFRPDDGLKIDQCVSENDVVTLLQL